MLRWTNVPLECTGVQYLTLELLYALKLGDMWTRIDTRSDNDLVEVLWSRSFDIDYPAIVLPIAMHSGDYCTQAQPGGQIEVLYIVFEVLLHMASCAMTGSVVGKREVCEAALLAVSTSTRNGLSRGELPSLWRY